MVLSEIDQKLVDEGYLWVDEQGNFITLKKFLTLKCPNLKKSCNLKKFCNPKKIFNQNQG